MCIVWELEKMSLGSKEMIPIFVGNIDFANSNKNV